MFMYWNITIVESKFLIVLVIILRSFGSLWLLDVISGDMQDSLDIYNDEIYLADTYESSK